MAFSKSFLFEIVPGTRGSKHSLDSFAPAETFEIDLPVSSHPCEGGSRMSSGGHSAFGHKFGSPPNNMIMRIGGS
jgi:hypothetical protein